MNDVERTGVVKFVGHPVTLIGPELKPGDALPEADTVGEGLDPVKLSSLKGKVLLILSLPSLDTPVCDKETRAFSVRAGSLGPQIEVVAVSMDLPFAQARWAREAGVENITFLSDYRDASFGKAFGVLAKENRLLARAVFVADAQGIIRYIQLMDDVVKEPDYLAAEQAALAL